MRFISPAVAAGSHTWQAWPILVGTISTSTANSPPCLIASDDRVDHGLPVAVGDRGHRVLHQVGPLLVRLLELVGVERGLVVIAAPDMVNAALAADEKLVDIGRGPRTGIVGTHIAFLVAAEANDAAAHLADVAGGERDVHQAPLVR